ncbi:MULTISPECIES: rod shape-determining protein RodA [Gammaproteobacteria]|uniref:rod shape-determining protein RodA n=1 Tax=Gammaproteobacteria TaxID=1236 RepID=UPI000DD0C478|nr:MULTISPECIES: rod shape-determining protein RodA [Gammaproteobacteria]RTE87456.1 rod shape-determining protein RodA [Aliidiomarina sp. B3213]TCZ92759.1 rod shape-determining protein RodA [Lysobacter sp. N42]
MQTTEERDRHPLLAKLHIDGPLFLGLLALCVVSLFVIYSAGGENSRIMIAQSIRIGLSFAILFIVAQINPARYSSWAVLIYLFGVALLVAVLFVGVTGKGAQRWLDLGIARVQPSEVLKLAVPFMLAWYCARKELPIRTTHVIGGLILVMIPTFLIYKQPDLGTAILVATSGIFVLFLAGMSWRLITLGGFLAALSLPLLWIFALHDYQKQRVLTFLNPESDPLGAGYHIIQSKIAIGSGGVEGKGWLQGTQSQLEFLPERHTDFIFSVFSEEFGLIGVLGLLILYGFVITRSMLISIRAQSMFTRLMGGSITLTFFIYVLVNIGMVSGLLPVVGVPLPLISYGGTSMVTMMAGFGIIMAIATHRRLVVSN